MSFSFVYRPLCTVNIYHEYFLNDGLIAFDSSEKLKKQQLSKYDVREFIDIIPSEETYHLLNSHKIIYKPTETGFTILIQAEAISGTPQRYTPKTSLKKETTFHFLLYINDFLFENYATVNAIPTVPFYFSNDRPASEDNDFTYIDMEETTQPISDFRISEATWTRIKKQFLRKETESLFGVISLKMGGDNTIAYNLNRRNLISKTIPSTIEHKKFKIQFANRKTIWHYKNALNNSLLHSTEPKQLPLVKNGTIEYMFNSRKQPAALPNRLIVEKDNLGNITKTISEIYIN